MNDYVVNPNEQVLVDTGINIGLPKEQDWIY
jgi:hypothetical protein